MIVELELEFVVVAVAAVVVKLVVPVDSGMNEESGSSIRTA